MCIGSPSAIWGCLSKNFLARKFITRNSLIFSVQYICTNDDIIFKTTDPQSEADIKLWKETWNELVPSTEAGIRLHLPELVDMVCPALEAQSWAIKAQGASAIATITEKMSER